MRMPGFTPSVQRVPLQSPFAFRPNHEFGGLGVGPLGNLPDPVVLIAPGENFRVPVSSSRASTAWRTNHLGQTVSVAQNEAAWDYNPSTLAFRGLRSEPARTNLVNHATNLESSLTWAVVSATRTKQSGTTLGQFERTEIASNGGAFHNVRNSNSGISVTNGTVYAIQVFFETAGTSGRFRVICRDNAGGVETLITGAIGRLAAGSGFAGNITNVVETIVGSGVVRLTFNYTPNFTGTLWIGVGPDTATTGQTCIVNYVGCEVGSFPTSPIITNGTAVTRAADANFLTQLERIGFNPTEGTLVCEFEMAGLVSGQTQRVVHFDEGFSNNNNSISFSVFSGNLVVSRRVGGPLVGDLNAGAVNALTSIRFAASYSNAGVAASLNRGAVVTNGVAGLPTGITALKLGYEASLTNLMGGWISYLAYYPVSLPNNVLPVL